MEPNEYDAERSAVVRARGGCVITRKSIPTPFRCRVRIPGEPATPLRAWPDDLGILRCADACTALTAVAGPDGGPLERADVW